MVMHFFLSSLILVSTSMLLPPSETLRSFLKLPQYLDCHFILLHLPENSILPVHPINEDLFLSHCCTLYRVSKNQTIVTVLEWAV